MLALAVIEILCTAGYTRPISLLVYTTAGYANSDIDLVYTAAGDNSNHIDLGCTTFGNIARVHSFGYRVVRYANSVHNCWVC